MLVAIDNGHGINTAGKRTPPFPKTGKVIKEWEFNHPTAKKLEKALRRCGLETLMVSDTSADTALATRVNRANNAKADVFVSIHYNAYKGVWGTHGGVDTFYYKDPLVTATLRRGSSGPQVTRLQTILRGLGFLEGNIDGSFGPQTERSVRAFQKARKLSVDGIVGPATRGALFPVARDKALASAVQKELVIASGKRDRGIKSYNFYVCRWTAMPAILCECGFMDNLEEAGLMLDDNYQTKIAEGIAKGICTFLGKKYVPVTNPSGILYKVQIGAYGVKKNAEEQAKKARAKGFDTYIEEVRK